MGGRSSSFGKKAGGGAKLDLPELEGSEKQIKWAKDIRQRWLDTFKSIDDFDGDWVPDRINFRGLDKEYEDDEKLRSAIAFARSANMGESGSYADIPSFESGGGYKGWLKDSYEYDMSLFVPSEKAQKQAVKSYYTSLMSTYNRYAPKGKYPKDSKIQDREAHRKAERQAYRKTVTAMARKGMSKITDASDYINHHRL